MKEQRGRTFWSALQAVVGIDLGFCPFLEQLFLVDNCKLPCFHFNLAHDVLFLVIESMVLSCSCHGSTPPLRGGGAKALGGPLAKFPFSLLIFTSATN